MAASTRLVVFISCSSWWTSRSRNPAANSVVGAACVAVVIGGSPLWERNGSRRAVSDGERCTKEKEDADSRPLWIYLARLNSDRLLRAYRYRSEPTVAIGHFAAHDAIELSLERLGYGTDPTFIY